MLRKHTTEIINQTTSRNLQSAILNDKLQLLKIFTHPQSELQVTGCKTKKSQTLNQALAIRIVVCGLRFAGKTHFLGKFSVFATHQKHTKHA